ncbi:hypothetical protein NDU88_011464 [Pleurodeles waltl]|uniref:Uncharacterized protein n=1 Tax=Pleurodeles waltl TaxID=8319 RepID=A0AAV7PXT9_PLEWA|nr:hypothetical protein NDU88_011464 [Pleurodeles waltl]
MALLCGPASTGRILCTHPGTTERPPRAPPSARPGHHRAPTPGTTERPPQAPPSAHPRHHRAPTPGTSASVRTVFRSCPGRGGEGTQKGVRADVPGAPQAACGVHTSHQAVPAGPSQKGAWGATTEFTGRSLRPGG